MGALEKFLHDEADRTPVLIKAALAHVQFETIHPFLDGNGRVGRLLITLLLCAEGLLAEPLLYLSLYFKTHRERYYELLQSVRRQGDWEDWLEFFLTGVAETAEEASAGARQILNLFARDRQRVEGLGRAAGSALRLHQLLQKQPLLTIRRAAQRLRVSLPTAATTLARLEELGIVREVTGRPRDRLFTYQEYLEIISQGDEPLRAG
jgi:Fic family protein